MSKVIPLGGSTTVRDVANEGISGRPMLGASVGECRLALLIRY